jgi:hypothetical protein
MSIWQMLTVLFGFAPMAYMWQPWELEGNGQLTTGERDVAEDGS